LSPLTLALGARLGPYEIAGPLGAGGMGEVYRATDTNLKRQVAIKVLPASVATDAERLARFQREAEVLAALNHPNIAHIHGLEKSDGAIALIMELVEGPTLADRIANGPISIDESLPIAKQIAEALEAAHQQGIIHRDLKPANIKVRPDGMVKILDFGLAKAMDPVGASAMNATMSPTLSMHATQAGIILGTAAYMSPEQARGSAADKRADLWALGVVLYEMLTATPLFEGATISDTLASVLKTEADWAALPAQTPASIRRLLRRCLEKDRKRRLADAADARLEIEEGMTAAGDDAARLQSAPAPRSAGARALPWAVTAVFGVIALLASAPWHSAVPPHVTRATITTAGPAALAVNALTRDVALSPDGTHLVYIGNNGSQLFVRALDTFESVAIASGSAIRGPFVSTDGQWVGFASNNNLLKKVAITGGPPITITSTDSIPFGATWAPDDTIVFATGNPSTGLQRVPAAGGAAEVLTRPDHAQGEADHLWPELLPGGRHVLFTITSQTGGIDTAQVAVHDLRTGTNKILLRGGSHAQYVASGHLVYVTGGALQAISFDLNRLETHGTSVSVLPRLVTTAQGAGDYSVARDGTLVYVDASGSLPTSPRTLVWVDRTGKEGRSPCSRARICSPASRPTGRASRSRSTIRRTTCGSGTCDGRRSRT
jgi:hypothetical protein